MSRSRHQRAFSRCRVLSPRTFASCFRNLKAKSLNIGPLGLKKSKLKRHCVSDHTCNVVPASPFWMVPANVDNVRTSSSGSISDVDSVVAIRGPCEASSYAHAPCTLAEKMPKMNISRSCTIQTAVRELFYFLTSQQKNWVDPLTWNIITWCPKSPVASLVFAIVILAYGCVPVDVVVLVGQLVVTYILALVVVAPLNSLHFRLNSCSNPKSENCVNNETWKCTHFQSSVNLLFAIRTSLFVTSLATRTLICVEMVKCGLTIVVPRVIFDAVALSSQVSPGPAVASNVAFFVVVKVKGAVGP